MTEEEYKECLMIALDIINKSIIDVNTENSYIRKILKLSKIIDKMKESE